jgi:hypothetical protein
MHSPQAGSLAEPPADLPVRASLPMQRSTGGPGAMLNLELTAVSVDDTGGHADPVTVGIAGHPRMDETVLFLAIAVASLGVGTDQQSSS